MFMMKSAENSWGMVCVWREFYDLSFQLCAYAVRRVTKKLMDSYYWKDFYFWSKTPVGASKKNGSIMQVV